MEVPKSYDVEASETKWQKYWEKEKIYAFNPKQKGEIYSVDTPPPTVSGKMHLGHSFSYAQQDIVVRYKRMAGFNVFYPFGTDDNGLPTKLLIEKTKNDLYYLHHGNKIINKMNTLLKKLKNVNSNQD